MDKIVLQDPPQNGEKAQNELGIPFFNRSGMEIYARDRFHFLNLLRYITICTHRKEMNETNGIREAAVRAEYEVILAAMKKVKFNKTEAAKYLGIDRKTLYTKLKAYYKLTEKGGD